MNDLAEKKHTTPPGWITARIEDTLIPIRGISFPKDAKRLEPGEGLIACLRTANIQQNIDWHDLWFVDNDYLRRDEQIIQQGDILISVSNSLNLLGKVAQVKHIPYQATLGTFIANLRVPKTISDKFVYYYLSSSEFKEAIREQASTTTNISNISVGKLEKLYIKLAPIAEQQRIVDKIEELFSDLDSGINSLKTAQQQLKVYRQAVLKWAFEGKLTAQWREEQQRQGKLTSADTLLAQIKAERDRRYQKELEAWQSEVEAWEAKGKEGKKPRKPKTQKDISPLTKADLEKLPNITTDWQWVKVGLLLLEPPCNGRSVKDKPGGFRVLRLTCIKQGFIDLKENKEGDWNRSEAVPYIVRPGDFLISRGNGSIKLVGRGGVVIGREDVAYPDTMVRLPINQAFYVPKLFSLIWNSDFFRKQIEKAARTTAGIHKINQNHILNFAFPLISLSEQERILEEIESRLSICDQLEADIEANLKKAEALRQSILKQAFEGKLVPQDPNDEPAAVLLERIRAERQTQADKGKAKSNKTDKSEQIQLGLPTD